ncbi:ATP-binding protein [Emticicia sp. W12TSBA100-4]|uniref:ATP-binding protein n=1 Tax=Emticicia sp. W12TSBA100-4 TaxID=3160965 RepID=UPI0033068753
MSKIDFSDVVIATSTMAVVMGVVTKILETKTRDHRLHTILNFAWLGMMLLSMLINLMGYETSYSTIICLTVLFAVQRSKGFPPARMLSIAFVPAAIVYLINDFFLFLTPNFFKDNKDYFDTARGFAFMWVLGFTIYAQRQAQRDKVVRDKAEAERRIIEAKKQELEYQVAERTAELTQQKESLELALEELKTTQNQLIQAEKMASLGELTAGIAHEIQNPLNFVNNFSEVSVELCQELQEELDKEDFDKTYIAEILRDISQNQQKITHHGQRAASIVRGMLQHSRASNGQKELTDINALADEYLRLSYHGLRAKDKTFNADFKTDLDPNLPKIEVIPQDFGRVLLNIINNAFYAVQQKAKQGIEGYKPLVQIKTLMTDEEIVIKITDNGGGMPENIKTKIFQPFFTTKPTGQGTGLGLSLSYDIITKGHAGTLEVESTEGEGTTFIITLPLK